MIRFYYHFICVALLIGFRHSYGKTTISLSQLVYALEHPKSNAFILKNTQIIADTLANRYVSSSSDTADAVFEPIIIKQPIEISNCIIERSAAFQYDKSLIINFRNIVFKDKVIFQNLRNSLITLNFSNCVFENSIEIWNSDLSHIDFERCTFKGTNKFIENTIPVQLSFVSCSFYPIPNTYNFELIISNGSGIINGQFLLSNNHFYGSHKVASVGFNMENIFIGFKNNVFEGAVQMDVHCKQGLEVINNTFEWINPGHSQFPVQNTLIPWNQFGENLRAQFDSAGYEQMYDTFDQYIYNENAYRAMRSRLSKFLSLYKAQLDNDSYNNCYIFVKDFETKRLIYENSLHPSFNKIVDIKMNQFLRFFCDYATNYVKAIVFSCYLLVFFALIYFVFPSQKDNLRWKRILNYLSYLMKSVSAEQKGKALPGYFLAFEAELKGTKRTHPKVLLQTGNLAIVLYRFERKIASYFHSKLTFNLKKTGAPSVAYNRTLNVWILGNLFFFLLWGLFIRALNAASLSLNAFITLGYGEIQAKGIARYLAIIEGVCGWFLLSIFSVSLISQLIQ